MERERAPDDLLENVWLSELSRLLPELKERYPDLPSPTSGGGETAKGALFEAIARMVEALASRAPVVLFLDDLQWADAATLEVLEYAGRRWAEQGAPVLVLIAARPEEPEAGSAFERWLSSLGRGLPLRSMTLGPLTDEEVEGLLGRLATRASSSKPLPGLWRRRGSSNEVELGLKQFGRTARFGDRRAALLPGGDAQGPARRGHAPHTKPRGRGEGRGGRPGLAEPEERLERPAAPERAGGDPRAPLSSLACGLGAGEGGGSLERGFGFESVVGVAGLGEAEGLRGLDELIERHLLREEAGGREERSALRPERHLLLHAREDKAGGLHRDGACAAEAVAPQGFRGAGGGWCPSPAQLARHALAGGLAEQAFRYSVAAGDAAMEVFAVKDAIEHYERARDLLAEVRTGSRQLIEPSVPDLEHLYIQLGRAYEMPEEWEQGQGGLRGDARSWPRGRGSEARGGRPQQPGGPRLPPRADPPRAKALLEEARRVAEEAGLEEALVETECNLADLMIFWAGEFEHSRPLARKALASARALEERPDLVARALATLARLELFRGRLEESAAYAEEGAELSRELAERPPPRGRSFLRCLRPWGSRPRGERATRPWRSNVSSILRTTGSSRAGCRKGSRSRREALAMSRELPERAEAMGSWALGTGARGDRRVRGGARALPARDRAGSQGARHVLAVVQPRPPRAGLRGVAGPGGGA